MASKTFKDLKARMLVISSELQLIVEDEPMEETIKSELMDIVDQMMFSASVEGNGGTKQEIESLSEFCHSVAIDIDLIVQSNELEDGCSERLEDVSRDASVAARQFRDLNIRKNEENQIPGVRKMTLFDFGASKTAVDGEQNNIKIVESQSVKESSKARGE